MPERASGKARVLEPRGANSHDMFIMVITATTTTCSHHAYSYRSKSMSVMLSAMLYISTQGGRALCFALLTDIDCACTENVTTSEGDSRTTRVNWLSLVAVAIVVTMIAHATSLSCTMHASSTTPQITWPVSLQMPCQIQEGLGVGNYMLTWALG